MIGCGRAARVVARLLCAGGRTVPGVVVNRGWPSARSAARFVGGARAAVSLAEAGPARAWLIGTPDDAIAPAAAALAESGRLQPGDVVFHLSGATPADVLAPCRREGAVVAAVHPVKNFSDPAVAARTFEGTWCGCEGDERALRWLRPAFRSIGARTFAIDPHWKPLYHGGGAFACNFLPVLIELALACEQRAGVARADALTMFEPIVRETIDAIFRQGVAPALAGPISRGDAGSVARHLAAMQRWNPEVADTYRALARTAIEIVASLGRVEPQRLAATRKAIAAPVPVTDGGGGAGVPARARRSPARGRL